jgi:hypothetical protein
MAISIAQTGSDGVRLGFPRAELLRVDVVGTDLLFTRIDGNQVLAPRLALQAVSGGACR